MYKLRPRNIQWLSRTLCRIQLKQNSQSRIPNQQQWECLEMQILQAGGMQLSDTALSMCKALDSILSTRKGKGRKKKKINANFLLSQKLVSHNPASHATSPITDAQM